MKKNVITVSFPSAENAYGAWHTMSNEADGKSYDINACCLFRNQNDTLEIVKRGTVRSFFHRESFGFFLGCCLIGVLFGLRGFILGACIGMVLCICYNIDQMMKAGAVMKQALKDSVSHEWTMVLIAQETYEDAIDCLLHAHNGIVERTSMEEIENVVRSKHVSKISVL